MALLYYYLDVKKILLNILYAIITLSIDKRTEHQYIRFKEGAICGFSFLYLRKANENICFIKKQTIMFAL